MRLEQLYICLFLLYAGTSTAQEGNAYSVEVSLENYSQPQLYMAQYFGERPYIMDTTTRNAEGQYIFSDKEALEPGVYFVVLPPNNDFIQFMLNEKEQYIQVEADADDLTGSLSFEGSVDNDLFLEYQDYIKDKRQQIKQLQGRLQAEESKGEPTDIWQAKIDSISKEVNAYKLSLYDKHPHTVTATMLRADVEVPMPDFDESNPDTLLARKFYFKKQHYFDNMDLGDERLLRTPVLKQKVDFYLNRLTPQTADSVIASLDHMLNLASHHQENFQYLFVQFINAYAQSNTMGFDAILVHLVENYVQKGRTPFLDSGTVNQLKRRASKLKPLLIGKPAPPLQVYTQDKRDTIDLYDVEADYMVLLFWKPSCGTCQKSMPDIIKFAKEHEAENIKVFAICVDQGKKADDCWPYIKAKGMDQVFVNTYDPTNLSRFYQKYDLTSTPRLMLLDKEKTILVNKMGSQQLEELLQAVKKRIK